MKKKIFKVPVSYITDETADFEVYLKLFDYNISKEELKEHPKMQEIFNLIEDYIKKTKVAANAEGLYNYLFNNIPYFLEFKIKEKDGLGNNNLHLQIIV